MSTLEPADTTERVPPFFIPHPSRLAEAYGVARASLILFFW